MPMFRFILFLFLLFSFRLGYTQVTSLVTPSNQHAQLNGTVLFEWNSVSGATQYELQLDVQSNFSTAISYFSTATMSSQVLTAGNYFWRVRADIGGIWQNWSGSRELHIVDLSALGTLSVWLDASNPSSLTLSGVNQVDSWQDQANGHVFTQATPANKPTVNPSVTALNNKDVIHFNGSQWVTTTPAIGVNGFTFFTIRNYTPSALAIQYFFSGVSNGFISAYNGGSAGFGHYSGSLRTSTTAFLNPGYGLYEHKNGFLSLNGSEVSYSGTSTPTSLSLTTVGTRADATSLSFTGDIAEIILFNSSLSTADELIVQHYLRSKYAPAVNLGKDSLVAYSFCPIDIHAGTNFTSWLWSTGATTENIAISENGSYWVETTDIFGFVSRDTINVSFPTIPIVSNTLYCNGASINWDADLGSDYTYLWSDASTAHNLNIGTPGDYWVELTDTFGCTLRSDTLIFEQDPYTIWLGSDTTICAGNSVQLQSGVAETLTYAWSDGSTGNSLAINSTGTYWLDGTNTNGCTFRDSIDVVVSGIAPVAAFVPSQFCLADTLQLNDQSTADLSDPIAIWKWDFNDGSYAFAADTAHLFATSGTYNVELYVESTGGCADSVTQSVTIHAMPSASFTASNFCLNDTLEFTNSSLPGDGTTLNYIWNFGDPSGTMPNTSTASDPTHYYGNVGPFTTTLIATDDLGCSDEVQVNFTILPVPQAIFTAQNACQESPLTLTNSSTMAAPNSIQSYLWDFDDLTTSSLQLPVKSYANFGYKDITLTVTADNGCSDTAMAQVLIHSLPVVNFTAGPACAGTNVVLTDASTVTTGTVAQSDWELDLSVMESGSPLNYSFNTPGSHTVTLTSTSDFGCVSTFSDVVNVYDTLTADWTVSTPVIIPGDNIDFSYTGQNGSIYSWDFGNGQTASTANASTTFSTNSDDAVVSLIVISPEGCEDTLVRSIPIGDPVLDLEVGDIYFQDQSGYYLVAVQLFNRGTLPIDMASVELVMNNGTKVMETYDQVIPYQGSAVLVFDSHPNAYFSLEDSTDAWICAEGTAYSSTGYLETILDNNRNCKNREGKRPVLIGPYPNPADQYMTYTLVLSKTENVTLELIDMRGRVVARLIDHIAMGKGSYPNTVDLSALESDMYLLRLRTDDYEEVLRLIIR